MLHPRSRLLGWLAGTAGTSEGAIAVQGLGTSVADRCNSMLQATQRLTFFCQVPACSTKTPPAWSPLLQRSETVPDTSTQRQQRAPQPPPSAVAVRSSREAAASLSHPPPPPVQASPFAASAALPMPVGASSAPAKAASPFAQQAASAEGGPSQGGEAADVKSASRPSAAALVSPFSSGALPQGLDFDVQHRASAAEAAPAAGQPQAQQSGGSEGR